MSKKKIKSKSEKEKTNSYSEHPASPNIPPKIRTSIKGKKK